MGFRRCSLQIYKVSVARWWEMKLKGLWGNHDEIPEDLKEELYRNWKPEIVSEAVKGMGFLEYQEEAGTFFLVYTPQAKELFFWLVSWDGRRGGRGRTRNP